MGGWPFWQLVENNGFYTDFDFETLPGPRPVGDHRSPFAVDRDRITFSYAYRRLQSKTQVFQSGEFDFYRTRLTHSIEVARIGRSLADFLLFSSPILRQDFRLDPDLIEGICLAHDLGHPPFGHIGERTLNELMADYGGFEGNGQTLRILTQLIYAREEGALGMSPTRAFLDGVLKYKKLHRECFATGPRGEPVPPHNHFIYDDQEPLRNFALGSELIPGELDSLPDLNSIRSIECQIMDWADDTAYSLNDIVDGIEARYITGQSLDRWMARQGEISKAGENLLEDLKKSVREGYYVRKFAAKVRDFIQAARLEEKEGIFAERSHRYRFQLTIEPARYREALLYKRVANDLIFQSTAIQQIEFKGGHLLRRLFDALMDNYSSGVRCLKITNDTDHRILVEASHSRPVLARAVCDYLSGLTDGQAVRTYKRLFDPEFASILDLS